MDFGHRPTCSDCMGVYSHGLLHTRGVFRSQAACLACLVVLGFPASKQ